jgi:hypothetical protein
LAALFELPACGSEVDALGGGEGRYALAPEPQGQ